MTDSAEVARTKSPPTPETKPGVSLTTQTQPPLGEQTQLQPGSFVDRYEIRAELGAGGMGVVYRAYDPQLARDVALKVISPTWRDGGAAVQYQRRLIREAQALAKLSHPNVVTVFDVGTFQGTVFVAMELVEGTSLRQWLRESPLDREIYRVLVAAGRGLVAAHDAGVVHRDFKPENVMVSPDGRVRVVDFGLARSLGDDVDPEMTDSASGDGEDPSEDDVSAFGLRLTRSGAILGTLGYVSPEQLFGSGATPAGDQFSYAVTCFVALTGGFPFSVESLDAYRKALETTGAPRVWRRAIPRRVRTIVERGLSRRVSERYDALETMVDALERATIGRARSRSYLAGALVVVGMGAWALSRWAGDAGDPCAFDVSPVADAWSPQRIAALEARFDDAPPQVLRDRLDAIGSSVKGYAEHWLQTRRAACRATHVTREQSEELYLLQSHCLEDSRRAVGQFLELLQEAPRSGLDRAPSSIETLGSIEACEDTPALLGEGESLPDDPDARQAIETLRTDLQRVKALDEVGQLEPAQRLADELLARAVDLGHPSTQARVLLQRARVQRSRAEIPAAESTLRQAISASAEAGIESLTTQIAAEFVELFTYENRILEARALAPFVEASTRKPGFPSRARAALLLSYGKVLSEQFEYEQGEKMIQAGIELLRSSGSTAEYAGYTMLANQIYRPLDRWDDARAALEKSLELKTEVFGKLNPTLLGSYFNLAALVGQQERLDDALEWVQRGRDLAAELQVESWDNDFLELEGYVRRLGGDCAGSITVYERAIDGYTRSHGEDSIRVAQCERERGACLSVLERSQDAEQAFVRSLAIFRAKGASAHELVDTLMAYSNAVAADDDLDRADALAVEALELARTAGSDSAHAVAEIDAWRERLARNKAGRGDVSVSDP